VPIGIVEDSQSIQQSDLTRSSPTACQYWRWSQVELHAVQAAAQDWSTRELHHALHGGPFPGWPFSGQISGLAAQQSISHAVREVRRIEAEKIIRVKWSERARSHRWAIIGAFAGMIPAAWAVFEFAYFGSTFDRYLIMVAGLLGAGGLGALLAPLTAPRNG